MKKHIHHKIPRHMGGTDDPDNLVELTVEEHAEAHKVLWEQHGKWQDYIAWQGLSGRLGKEELIREAARQANLGKEPYHKGKKVGPRSEATKLKISQTMKERGIKPKPSMHWSQTSKANEVAAKIGASNKGKHISDEHKAAVSRAHKGRKHTQEHIQKRVQTRGKLTEHQKSKMQEGLRRYWELKRSLNE